jgi:hypothetical protein
MRLVERATPMGLRSPGRLQSKIRAELHAAIPRRETARGRPLSPGEHVTAIPATARHAETQAVDPVVPRSSCTVTNQRRKISVIRSNYCFVRQTIAESSSADDRGATHRATSVLLDAPSFIMPVVSVSAPMRRASCSANADSSTSGCAPSSRGDAPVGVLPKKGKAAGRPAR